MASQLQTWISVCSLVVGLLAGWQSLVSKNRADRLAEEVQTQRLALEQAEGRRKEDEANRKLVFDVYNEVKSLLVKARPEAREEEAVRILVQSLADGEFRVKLLDVLAAGAKDPTVQRQATKASQFYVGEIDKLPASPTPPKETDAGFGAWNVDAFYCEGSAAGELGADKALALKGNATGRWRKRLLPETINAGPGYGLHGNVIRYNAGEEAVAKRLQQGLAASGAGVVDLQRVDYPTPGYVSVFLCR